ncbi:MAG: TIGR03790 family protein [Betaproteobacteria bacterium]|nr:TIGR03790 family protein [Betaproteobacteria bacterium]
MAAWRHALLLLVGWMLSAGVAVAHADAMPRVFFPRTCLTPQELAVIVNDADPLSVRIGRYYAKVRRIPPRNVIHVRFPPGEAVMPPAQFIALKAWVDAHTPRDVQAFALTWTLPYRVGCMSITTAFAAGYDRRFCATGCKPTRFDPYFRSDSAHPYRDFGWRPTMMLAGTTFADVKALIDRGVASDGTHPAGTGYLVDTNDRARDVRAVEFSPLVRSMRPLVHLVHVRANAIERRKDVLFYFTGLARVPMIDSNRYLPGAIADHLTSYGGVLLGSSQMSALAWLKAGATGSYGTVVEPCDFPGKFPDPAVAISRYLRGETLIEAYWKSVAMPGQGVFIGEPLARPYGGHAIHREGRYWAVDVQTLPPGFYGLYGADSGIGPYRRIGAFAVSLATKRIEVLDTGASFYRIVRRSSGGAQNVAWRR